VSTTPGICPSSEVDLFVRCSMIESSVSHYRIMEKLGGGGMGSGARGVQGFSGAVEEFGPGERRFPEPPAAQGSRSRSRGRSAKRITPAAQRELHRTAARSLRRHTGWAGTHRPHPMFGAADWMSTTVWLARNSSTSAQYGARTVNVRSLSLRNITRPPAFLVKYAIAFTLM